MTRRQLTHCQRGHPFDDKNTHVYRDKSGRLRRVCRRCAKMRNPFRQRLYGLSADEYAELVADQNNVCAICGQPSAERALAVDHDHSSGDVRGLLCAPCNTGLGVFRDDPLLLRKAISYLTAHLRGREAASCPPLALDAVTADQLSLGFDVLVDAFAGDIEWLSRGEAFQETFMWTMLPQAFEDRYDLRFATAFLLATARVQERSRLVVAPVTTCTAEELAFSAAVRTAAVDARDAGDPETAERSMRFLDDHVLDCDLRLLFDEGLVLSQEQARLNGVTHLWFDDWFRPFSVTSDTEKAALN